MHVAIILVLVLLYAYGFYYDKVRPSWYIWERGDGEASYAHLGEEEKLSSLQTKKISHLPEGNNPPPPSHMLHIYRGVYGRQLTSMNNANKINWLDIIQLIYYPFMKWKMIKHTVHLSFSAKGPMYDVSPNSATKETIYEVELMWTIILNHND